MELIGLILLACSTPEPVQLTVEGTEVASVVRVSWEDADATLRWEDDQGWHDAEVLHTEDGPMAWIIAAPDTPVLVELTTWDGRIALAEHWTESDGFVVDLESTQGQFASSTATTVFADDGWMPAIFGKDGQPRWWLEFEESGLTSLRTRPVADGVWVNHFTTSEELPAPPQLVHYGWDGEVLETLDAPTNHHDFWVHEDGRITWIGWEDLGDGYYGDTLMTRDPDGTVRLLFSTSQLGDVSAMLHSAGLDRVWSNHLDFDGTDYWLSMRNLDQVARISTDGTLVSTVGRGGDVEVIDQFSGQHGGERTAEGLLLHDNGGSSQGVRVCEYALDGDSSDAQLLWSRQPNPAWKSMALGDAMRIDNGNTRISWGVFSTVEEVSASGEVLGSLEVEASSIVGFLTDAEALD